MTPDPDMRYAQRRAFRTTAPDYVLSGAGTRHEVARLVDRLGATRALVATSQSVHTKTPLVSELTERLESRLAGVFSECRQHAPAASVQDLTRRLVDSRADVVVAIGGSSVSDAVKAAALAAAELSSASGGRVVPQIAIPTTLSGGEFTAGAGVTNDDHTKQLVTDARLMPRVVVLDPEATVFTPETLWLSSGVKAIEHAMEALWSYAPHPVVDALALESIRVMTANLGRSRDTGDLEARAACQQAVWMSLAGTSTSGIRLSHLVGHQVGSHWDIPHGLTASVLLPTVMRFLAPVTLSAQLRIAEALGVPGMAPGRDAATVVRAGADHLEQLVRELGLPTRIGEAGGRAEEIDRVAEAAFEVARSLNLVKDLPQGPKSVRELLEMAW